MAEEASGEAGHDWRVLQFLTTEHFTLQTARSATIFEANGRASLFVTAVSAALIAMGFLAQATEMGGGFVLFGAVVLPCLYFLGVAAFVRALQTGLEDAVHLRGIIRIRHYYLELAPEMRRYLIHPATDDRMGLARAMGIRPAWWQLFFTTSGMVAVLASVIAGAFVALLARGVFGAPLGLAVALGAAAFVASVCWLLAIQHRTWESLDEVAPPEFRGS